MVSSIHSQLPDEIEAAVAAQHGGPVAVSGRQAEHVVMTMAIFRGMMGVGSDQEFEKSVADIKTSLGQAAAGQTIALDEAPKTDREVWSMKSGLPSGRTIRSMRS